MRKTDGVAKASELLRKLDCMYNRRIEDIRADIEIQKARGIHGFSALGLTIDALRLYHQYVKEARSLIGGGSPNDDFHPEGR